MKKKIIIALYTITFLGIVFFISLLLLTANGFLGKLPSLEELETPESDLASEVIADDGSLIGKFYIKDRIPVPYDKISKNLIIGLIATEDERFFDHSGVDFWSLGRAIFGVFTFSNMGGGSTITQQLAHNLLYEIDENYVRSRNPFKRAYQKLKEWVVAIRLEKNFTKEEIISYYFNTIPFGYNIYGIKNASHTFFKKNPSDIEIHEAALLIGILKGNTIYNPVINPQASLHRRNIVIDQIEKNGYITEKFAEQEKAKGLSLNYEKLDEISGIATHFREELRKSVKDIVSKLLKPNGEPYNIYKDGLKIYTTINPTAQKYAEISFREHIKFLQNEYFKDTRNKLYDTVWSKYQFVLDIAIRNSLRWKNLEEQNISEEKIIESFNIPVAMTIYNWESNSSMDTIMTPLDSIKYHKQILQGGILAMDHSTGEIKAWVGGNNFRYFKFDHVNINTKRQIGSAIKPLLYSLAFSDLGFSPYTKCPNVSQCFPDFENWCSHNNDYTQSESTTLEKGLIHSYNNVSAYLMKLIGPKRFAEFLRECNISSPIPYVPSISLGTPEMSLFEITWAYTMFPGKGYSVKPYFIRKIEDKNGNIIASFVSEKNQIINENDAYKIVDILRKATHYGTSYQLRTKYNITLDLAGKTGTTNNNSDAWFIGFSPELLCGVWVGFEDNFISLKTNKGYGSQAAMPVFARFIEDVYSDLRLNYNPNKKFKAPIEFYAPKNPQQPSTSNKENETKKRINQFKKNTKKSLQFDK